MRQNAAHIENKMHFLCKNDCHSISSNYHITVTDCDSVMEREYDFSRFTLHQLLLADFFCNLRCVQRVMMG